MEKMPQIPDEKSFYRLPFEKGTFTLKEDTLLSHSIYRKSPSYFREKIKNISYKNEILTLSIRLEAEPKNRQYVYLKVLRDELLVSCSAGTTPTFLSRFAFFTLFDLAHNDWSNYFRKYYWPDFFDPKTGKSKYLTVINDRSGLDVEEKTMYPEFYKPGFEVLDLKNEPPTIIRSPIGSIDLEGVPEEIESIAFCIAKNRNGLCYAEHFPFLIPAHVKLYDSKDRIKIFTKFLHNEGDFDRIKLSAKQERLAKICFKMKELAGIDREDNWKKKKFTREDLEKGRQLLEIWHELFELLLAQRFVAEYKTHGFKSLERKPHRNSLYICNFRKDRPKLIIVKKDKGDYLTIELKLKIKGRTYKPCYPVLIPFISAHYAPREFYLLGNLADILLINFFSKSNFKMAVLKPHYKDEIMEFVNQLAERYELIES